MNILGISAFYHDAAACLVQDGRIVAAAQEERFSRRKHDAGFPRHAVAYCLRAGGVAATGIDAVTFYEKPITHFVRLMKTYLHLGPSAIRSFLQAAPVWLKRKLWIPFEIERQLADIGFRMPSKLYFTEHHEAHAASAFYPSPYSSAAVLTLDGVGEWATSTLSLGRGNELSLLKEIRFPHSLGLLYSAFTYFCGFKVNSGEYKLMGLAPYGEPKYVGLIRDRLLDLRADGSFRMDMSYFDFIGGLTMTNAKFADLFGGPPRRPESRITKREMDLASSIQSITEEIVLRMARTAAMTDETNLCLAGGVALNCVANGRLLREGLFKSIWIQPAAGDAGGALGCALHTWYKIQGNSRTPNPSDSMEGSYLGPSFGNAEIRAYLDKNGYPYEFLSDSDRAGRVAQLLADQNVVGLSLGRMEFGPRSLGHRSIIGDARSAKMQSLMNLKIKYRESFRPFAPSVLVERTADYFDLEVESPYMLLVAPVAAARRQATTGEQVRHADLLQWVNEVRSDVPAITHVDYSARVQTVSRHRNPDYYAILKTFEELTGCGVIINTSFNVRGEPIVCTPEDAYRCFMRCEMDALVLENAVLTKSSQPKFADSEDWQQKYGLD